MKETGKLTCKPVSSPIDPTHKLGLAKEETKVNKEVYPRLVGELIYLSHTILDIAYEVNVISQFMRKPKEVHLQAEYRMHILLEEVYIKEMYRF